jgi:hypothetical protein
MAIGPYALSIESPMGNCIYCGAETRLQVMGRPVCVDCVKEIEDGREPSRARASMELRSPLRHDGLLPAS